MPLTKTILAACGFAVCTLACERQQEAAPATPATPAPAPATTPAVVARPDTPLVAPAPKHNSAGADNSKLKSSMSGVFTAEQARLGADIYAGTCRGCHMGSSHTATFKTNWTGYPLSELSQYITDYMPKNAPGSLSAEDNTLVLAYLLQLTGMPAGSATLPGDAEGLSQIRFDTLPYKR